jgi:glycosyltransferase involved in cell wall biosynthesis
MPDHTPPINPIKVMHVIARLNIGGAALYVIQLTAQQKTLGCEASLVCGVVGPSEGDMQYIAAQKHIPVTVIPSLGREISPVSDLATVYKLWRIMRRERPDVVHTHTAKAGFVGRVAAKLAGVPVIVHTFHGHVFSGYFSPAKTRLFLWLERLSARLSSAIITLSIALKRDITEVYGITHPERVQVIELGFELDDLLALERHQGSFRADYSIPADVPLVGIVGRLVPIKNHDLFLQAARLVQEAVPDAHFAIIGDGERRDELGRLVDSLGLGACVHFMGWITDIPPVYGALDVLVLSSINEGLPVSLIEAMAAGVPIVATAVGGVNDLLQGGKLGSIVPPDDIRAMAKAVLSALSEPECREQALAARKAAYDRYGIQTSARLTTDLYQSLLRKR